MMDNGTLITITTLGIGLAGLIVRYIFRSNCRYTRCCYGLIEIERVIVENDIETSKDNNDDSSTKSKSNDNV